MRAASTTLPPQPNHKSGRFRRARATAAGLKASAYRTRVFAPLGVQLNHLHFVGAEETQPTAWLTRSNGSAAAWRVAEEARCSAGISLRRKLLRRCRRRNRLVAIDENTALVHLL